MEKIDFVITWVDGNDPEWLQERKKYLTPAPEDENTGDCRYRDWDLLKYWFRGVEKYAPWVNRIFFVTCGHLPQWLDTDCPKLQIVRHQDFIPAGYLPTFNSNVIEFYLHRIPGLSEHFVYFNDDHFFLKETKPERFFKKGLPCDIGGLFIYNRKSVFGTSVNLAVQLINEHFDKRETIRKAFTRWFNPAYPDNSLRNILYSGIKTHEFCGFFDHHLPQGFLKTTYEEVWENCSEDLIRTSKNKFRQYGDVAFWVLRYWQLASNRFAPYNVCKDGVYYIASEQNLSAILDCILNRRKKLLCLNDTKDTTNFEYLKQEIHRAFERILPEKCSFERI